MFILLNTLRIYWYYASYLPGGQWTGDREDIVNRQPRNQIFLLSLLKCIFKPSRLFYTNHHVGSCTKIKGSPGGSLNIQVHQRELPFKASFLNFKEANSYFRLVSLTFRREEHVGTIVEVKQWRIALCLTLVIQSHDRIYHFQPRKRTNKPRSIFQCQIG